MFRPAAPSTPGHAVWFTDSVHVCVAASVKSVRRGRGSSRNTLMWKDQFLSNISDTTSTINSFFLGGGGITDSYLFVPDLFSPVSYCCTDALEMYKNTKILIPILFYSLHVIFPMIQCICLLDSSIKSHAGRFGTSSLILITLFPFSSDHITVTPPPPGKWRYCLKMKTSEFAFEDAR